MVGVWITLGLVLLLLILFIVGFFLFRFVFIRKKDEIDLSKVALESTPYKDFSLELIESIHWVKNFKSEIVSITSFDGLKLVGHFFDNQSEKTIIVFHGYRSLYYNDFSISGKKFFELGYNVLFVNQRAHGESEGKYITFGILEKYDCKKWIEFTLEKYASKSIILAGLSMGCSTIELASNLSLPNEVKAMICDCGYSSVEDELTYQCHKMMHMPYFPFMNIVKLYGQLLGHFSFKEGRCYEALSSNTIPTLFIHGKKDDFVPLKQGIKNYEACSSYKEMIEVENASHAMSYLLDRKNVEEKIESFLNRVESQEIYE